MKKYLGDSVYAEWDAFRGVVLTTENGYGPSNTIVLEPEVLLELVLFVEKARSKPLREAKINEPR